MKTSNIVTCMWRRLLHLYQDSLDHAILAHLVPKPSTIMGSLIHSSLSAILVFSLLSDRVVAKVGRRHHRSAQERDRINTLPGQPIGKVNFNQYSGLSRWTKMLVTPYFTGWLRHPWLVVPIQSLSFYGSMVVPVAHLSLMVPQKRLVLLGSIPMEGHSCWANMLGTKVCFVFPFQVSSLISMYMPKQSYKLNSDWLSTYYFWSRYFEIWVRVGMVTYIRGREDSVLGPIECLGN